MIRDTSDQDVQLTPKSRIKARIMQALVVVVLIVVFIIVGLPSLAQWSHADLSVDRDRIRIATVEAGEFIRDINLQGNIVAANSPKLYAPAMGTVTLLANPGDPVELGQVIATITSPQLTNQLQQEQARLSSMGIELERQKISAKQLQIRSKQQVQLEKVILDAAEREMRRAEQSIKIQAISQIDYEQAIDELKRSRLKYEFALEQVQLEKEKLAFEIQTQEFEYNQFQLQLDNTQRLVSELTIKAPVAGIIGTWLVEQKSAVNLNQAMLTVVDLSAFQIEIDIPEGYADELAIGMQALVTYNQQEFSALVATISPEVSNNSVKGRLVFTAEPPSGLKQNQRVSSRIILEQKQHALYLPRGSFVQHHGGRRVFVVNDGIASLQDIAIGIQSVNKIEVLAGLEAGQQVIISNTDFVENAENLIIN